jgi:RNA recognition motif-containing protein
MNVYVGNLPFETTAEELKEMFVAYGEVSTANVITDRFSGKSKGFGFVEMPDAAQAQAAIAGLAGKDIGGRPLTVSEAKPRPDGARPGGGGGGGRRGRETPPE